MAASSSPQNGQRKSSQITISCGASAGPIVTANSSASAPDDTSVVVSRSRLTPNPTATTSTSPRTIALTMRVRRRFSARSRSASRAAARSARACLFLADMVRNLRTVVSPARASSNEALTRKIESMNSAASRAISHGYFDVASGS